MTTFKALQRIAAALVPLLAILVFAAPALAGEFGLTLAEMSATNRPTPAQEANDEPGSPDIQAGSHPYELTTTFALNEQEHILVGTTEEEVPSGGDLKDVRVQLPPGFVGNPNATPKCKPSEFKNERNETECPNDTAVGYVRTYLGETGEADTLQYNYAPIFNMEPPPGVPAQFAFEILGKTKVWLNATVRTGGDYGLTVTVPNIVQIEPIHGATVVFWGVPAEASHNPYRGECLDGTNGGAREYFS
jgi:hypothetical protein